MESPMSIYDLFVSQIFVTVKFLELFSEDEKEQACIMVNNIFKTDKTNVKEISSLIKNKDFFHKNHI